MGKFNHFSHGLGEHVTGHHGTNVAQNGAPKKVTAVEIHSGMRTKSANGDAYSGQHKSALDSLSGATVPAASVTSPGWGNGQCAAAIRQRTRPAGKFSRRFECIRRNRAGRLMKTICRRSAAQCWHKPHSGTG